MSGTFLTELMQTERQRRGRRCPARGARSHCLLARGHPATVPLSRPKRFPATLPGGFGIAYSF